MDHEYYDYLQEQTPPFKRRRLHGQLDPSSPNPNPTSTSTSTPVKSRAATTNSPTSLASSCERTFVDTPLTSSILSPWKSEETSEDRFPEAPEDVGSRTGFVGQEQPMVDEATLCFGMLMDLGVKLRDDITKTSSRAITSVTVQGELLTLEEEPDVVVGKLHSFTSSVLHALMARDRLELQLFLKHKSRKPPRGSGGDLHTLSANLYGKNDLEAAVGQWLEECDLHLQDPQHCDRNVLYKNPHLLVQHVRMTQEQAPEVLQDVQIFSNPVDMLAGLETEDSLPETNSPSALNTELFGHQKRALTFMLRREYGWAFQGPQPDLWRVDSCDGSPIYTNTITEKTSSERPPEFRGGILADQMGLGKSLTALALIASDQERPGWPQRVPTCSSSVRTTLLVVRASLLKTWAFQLNAHIKPGRLLWMFHHERNRITESSQLQSLDIVVTTYHSLMAEWKRHRTRSQLIFETRWRRLVLDEAHDIRDRRSVTAKALYAIEAESRWALTGTPIQNKISDLGSLFGFLRLHPYDDVWSFNELVARLCDDPINGINMMKQLLTCIMLRRSTSTVELPTRHDLMTRLDFNLEEQAVYDRIKVRTQELMGSPSAPPLNVLAWISKLLMICNLGVNADLPRSEILVPSKVGEADCDSLAAQRTFNSLVSAGTAICHGCSADLGAVATEVADVPSTQNSQPLLSACLRLICGPCLQNADTPFSCQHMPPCLATRVSSLSSNIHTSSKLNHSSGSTTSTKVQALVQDLQKHMEHEKSVVFSFWTTTLDHIEAALEQNGIHSVRIDGNIARKQRDAALERFRTKGSIRVALLTISCGAVGLDLTAASRAYLMEPHWNPSVEQQALARVYRMGQARPVTTTRYIMRNSLEEHVLNVQGRKTALTEMLIPNKDQSSNRVNSERIEVCYAQLGGLASANKVATAVS